MMSSRFILRNIDWYLLGGVFLLCLLGFYNLQSATAAIHSRSLLKNQLFDIGIGLFFMTIIQFFNYALFKRYAYFFYSVSLLFLLIVLFKGEVSNGSRAWLNLGFFRFQVSDLMKISLIIVIARWYSMSKVFGSYSLKDLLPLFILFGIPFFLILKQPDFGTGMLLCFVTFSIALFCKIRIKSIVVIVLLGSVVLMLAWFFVFKDYQKKRVYAFMDPMSSPKGAGYNVIQSMVAVGSGKFWGKGYKKGTQTSLHFLPEHHTDFIFSAWAEEHGFLGSFLLVILYLLIFFRIIWIANSAKDKFGILLALGGGGIFFWYFFINVNMVIGLLPVVGVPLPFFSYGGTAMVVNFIILGIILNVKLRRSAY